MKVKKFTWFTLSFLLVLCFFANWALAAQAPPLATPYDENGIITVPRSEFSGPPPAFGKIFTDSALSNGANRLIQLQSSTDGGWDWNIDPSNTSHSANASPTNTYGATAQGILGSYIVHKRAAELNALVTTYNGMNADPNINAGADWSFLVRLSKVTGNSAYANLAKSRYDARRTVRGGSTAWADTLMYVRAVVQGYPNGIIPWDLNLLTVAAAELNSYFPGQGYDADADTFAMKIYGDIYNNTPGYFDETDQTEWWWTLGIAGALESFVVSGNYPTEATQLYNTLLGFQNVAGYWDWNSDYTGGDYQTTAYAIMAMVAYGGAETNSSADNGALWLKSEQKANGSWYWVGYDEYTEEEGEVLWAISLVAKPIPTLSEWGLMIFGALLVLSLIWVIRKRMKKVPVAA
jgi:hypothetical protein